ncbi:hypothetical protein HDU97_005597 [Phlyctochytrium planicorne]|nr:hypothetical protein HDU97_005597 [Phlyctochytrium planicorne]
MSLRTIAIIGGTGAQGVPIVEALSKSKRYSVRVLTRDANSGRAKTLAALPNVSIVTGSYTNEDDVRKLFAGVYGAYVNTDGFSIGEREELYAGFRIFEIAAEKKLKHYIWGSVPHATHLGGYDPKIRAGHMDAKGRIAQWVLAQKNLDIIPSVLTSTAYVDMLKEGLLVPVQRKNTFVFNQPLEKGGRIQLLALEDFGHYALWMFDNIQQSAYKDLRVSSFLVDMNDIADAFNNVFASKGYKAVVEPLSFDDYMKSQSVPKDAPVTSVFMSNSGNQKDMTFWENFRGFFNLWNHPGNLFSVDFDVLDEIHPHRIRSVEEWMRKAGYDPKKEEKIFKNEVLDTSVVKITLI